MTPGQLLRTYTLLDTLLDYLPGPSMQRPASDTLPATSDPQAKTRTYTAAETSAQIAHLEHQARLRDGDWRGQREPWELARLDQYRQGDYARLDALLDDLRVLSPMRHSLAWRVATHHPALLDVALRVELVQAVWWLAERLPDPCRVPAWAVAAPVPSAGHIATLRGLGVPWVVITRCYAIKAPTIRTKRKAVA